MTEGPCHIVQVAQTAEGKRWVSSASVSDADLAALPAPSTSSKGLDWVRPSVREFHRWASERGLSRVVVIWNVPRGEGCNPTCEPVHIPPPLLTPNEPISLDAEAGRSLLPAKLLRASKRRAAARTRWWMHLLWVPATILVLIVALMVIPLAAFVAAAGWLVRLVYRVDWFVVPGAAIRRRVAIWEAGPTVEVFTPANWLLFVGAISADQWEARFFRERHVLAHYAKGQTQRTERRAKYERREVQLGDDALQVLLAAWQSPLPPPKADDLVDLR